MPEIVPIQIDGEEVFVEIDTHGSYYSEKVGVDKVASQAAGSFRMALKTIRLVASATVKEVRNIDDTSSPDEFQLTFGITLNGEYGAVIARVSGEAQISVTLTYKAPDRA